MIGDVERDHVDDVYIAEVQAIGQNDVEEGSEKREGRTNEREGREAAKRKPKRKDGADKKEHQEEPSPQEVPLTRSELTVQARGKPSQHTPNQGRYGSKSSNYP